MFRSDVPVREECPCSIVGDAGEDVGPGSSLGDVGGPRGDGLAALARGLDLLFKANGCYRRDLWVGARG